MLEKSIDRCHQTIAIISIPIYWTAWIAVFTAIALSRVYHLLKPFILCQLGHLQDREPMTLDSLSYRLHVLTRRALPEVSRLILKGLEWVGDKTRNCDLDHTDRLKYK
jgi:hypothetical protein